MGNSTDTPQAGTAPSIPVLEDLDWDSVRRKSLVPGGFGEHRKIIWPRLLHAELQPSHSKQTPGSTPTSLIAISDVTVQMREQKKDLKEPFEESSVESHRDERQIGLDTERSFVFYPVGSMKQRHILQGQLHELLVSIFRKRRKLSYFQGYHDVITVLFLTLPKELQLPCAEKLSLHRVRDSMGLSLEPVLGLLRILKNLLRLADPSFAALLERNSPLPFYALSNLLTLFSHDMPTLALIQHVFDFLLSRPPISAVYLAAAIILSRKQEVERLEEEGEDGMIHSLLSGLPDLHDMDEKEQSQAGGDVKIDTEIVQTKVEESQTMKEDDREVETRLDDVEIKLEQVVEGLSKGIDETPNEYNATAVTVPAPVFKDGTDTEPSIEPNDVKATPTDDEHFSESDKPQGDSILPAVKIEDMDEKRSPISSPPPAISPERQPDSGILPPRNAVSLSSLLINADLLYELFPPSLPSLSISETMGPQSVVYSWSQDPSELPSDDEAEAMVLKPELVVYPYVEPELSDEDEHTEKDKKRRRRKLRKPRRFAFGGRTMVAGAVLVLGVSMAVYGIRTGHVQRYGYGHSGRPWRRLGGVLVGASERIVEGFGLW